MFSFILFGEFAVFFLKTLHSFLLVAFLRSHRCDPVLARQVVRVLAALGFAFAAIGLSRLAAFGVFGKD